MTVAGVEYHVVIVGEIPKAAAGTLGDRPALTVETISAETDAISDAVGDADCLVVNPDDPELSVIAMIRQFAPALPIVIYTDLDADSFTATALQHGVSDYVDARATAPETLADRVIATLDAQTRHRQTPDRLRALGAFTSDLHGCTTVEKAVGMAADAATEILEFDRCSLGINRDGKLHVLAERGADHGEYLTLPNDEGVAGLTYQTGESLLTDDLSTLDRADSDDEAALLSVPVGDHGVFQAVGASTGVFDESDREVAIVLCEHLSETISRIRREEELKEQEAFTRDVLNALPDPVYIVDSTLKLQTFNDALVDAVGYDRETLREMAVSELLAEPARSRVEDKMLQLLDCDVTVRGEIEVSDADGTPVPYQVHVTDIIVDDEPMLLGVARDISERKAREAELRRQNERLDEFASVVSHDLRTPLNVANGRIELARETGDVSHLGPADAALDRMSTLIEDALTLARDGRSVESPSAVELVRLLRTAWNGVDSDGATLSLPEMTVPVYADEPRLRRCLENILRNAVEHADEPNIETTIQQHEQTVTLSITDDGPGIPAENRETVLESGYTTDSDGTGLGLGIVARIVDAHGWTLSLSESDRGGLCVEISAMKRSDVQ